MEDYLNRVCEVCKEGVYQETSISDDWDGIVHCNICNHEVDRYH